MARELPKPLRAVGLMFIAAGIMGMSMSFASEHPGRAARGGAQPLFWCENDGALHVRCHGSFDDGSSAAGTVVRVLDKHNQVILEGSVDAHGHFSFRKPDAEFCVVFDAGRGRTLTIPAFAIV